MCLPKLNAKQHITNVGNYALELRYTYKFNLSDTTSPFLAK